MIIGCGSDKPLTGEPVSVGGRFYMNRVITTVNGVEKELESEETVEVPLLGYLKIYLPCDYNNLYTWELTKPYPKNDKSLNDFRMDEITYVNNVGKSVPTQVWGFIVHESQKIEFFYYKKNVLDNLAPPDKILKKFAVMVKVNENKPAYE